MKTTTPTGKVSIRIIASYTLDWIVIVIIGLASYGFNKLTPLYHHFSLLDLSIAYPFGGELVSTTSLIIASAILPAVIVFLIAILLVPGLQLSRRATRSQLIRRKLWELNTGWLGLALSLVTALLFTTFMKSLFGKPRPDMLARCDPDPNTVRQHMIGGFTGGISDSWVLVDQTICRQTDKAILNDGFRSFPSGHSTTSWAGLLYLTLYLCSKFAVVLPYLPEERSEKRTDDTTRRAAKETIEHRETSSPFVGRRGEAAAPPLYLLSLLYIPLCVAIFISASRYYDYKHHGFDIISGSLIGALSAWFSFRLYHLPMTRGSGWSWGPRSAARAFGVGIGSQGYVEQEHRHEDGNNGDIEMGALPHNRGYSEGRGLIANEANRQANGRPLGQSSDGSTNREGSDGIASV